VIPKLKSKLSLFFLKYDRNLSARPKNNSINNVSAWIATTIVTVSIIVIKQSGGLQNLELLAYDWLVRLNNQNTQDERLLLVEITDTDIKNQDRWPLSDETLAQLLSTLQQYQPTVIGLDIYRDIAHPPGTALLRYELQKENVISIQYLGSAANQVAAPPEVSEAQIGFNDVVLDLDSKLRRNLMYARVENEELYSFALRLSLAYLRNNPAITGDFKLTTDNDRLYLDDVPLLRLQANSGGYQMQPNDVLGWQILIDYQSPNIAPRISLTDVLEGKIDPNLVKDKVVIIGTTASSINDFFFTPYGGATTDMAGAIAHSQMVSQIVNLALGEASQFWFFPETIELLWIAIWSVSALAIALRLENPLKIAGVGVFGILSLGVICWLAFIAGGWIPLIPTALSLGLTIASLLLQREVYTYFYDSLTGLPNQTLFLRQLQRFQKSSDRSLGIIMVLCIDLDRFKMINDALGYQAGDHLLVTTAYRLRESLAKSKKDSPIIGGVPCTKGVIFARVGGDEFAIAQVITDEATAFKIVNKLQTELDLPFDLLGLKTSTSVTTGIALHRLTENFDAKNILRAAQTAMYQAKASGKTNHRVFGTQMREQALKRLQLEADLYEAIKQQEFELYYQPIIDLKTGKIAGFESLIRWHSPQRGFVSPGAFIPIAEEIGAIIPLGEWILQEACQQMYQWQKEFPHLASLFISVNLSSRQFVQPNLMEMIQNILKVTGLNSNFLKLEITESMVMENVDQAITMLDNLKALGIQLSLDDFGTGFSSFSYLHRFPMDTLKVDRSFVSNMNQSEKNWEIVSTIILLAHKLGMDVVAEGIETDLEKLALTSLACEYGQGYLFAKPLPVAEVARLLASF
jgi:diguanylate cyclase (GGDEF)-like protein